MSRPPFIAIVFNVAAPIVSPMPMTNVLNQVYGPRCDMVTAGTIMNVTVTFRCIIG